MFKEATSFNQDLSDWDTSRGTGFVSHNMHHVQQYQAWYPMNFPSFRMV